MTTVTDPATGKLRLTCEVPHCGRTRGQRKGEKPIEGWEEWICGDHWRLVPKKMRRALSRARREGGRRRFYRLWYRCRREAIEVALGIRA